MNNISLASGFDPGGFSLFISGENFVNSTDLSCKIGGANTPATFLSGRLVLCFVPLAPTAMALEPQVEGDHGEDITQGFGPRKGDNTYSEAWLGPGDVNGKAFYVEVGRPRTRRTQEESTVLPRAAALVLPKCYGVQVIERTQ